MERKNRRAFKKRIQTIIIVICVIFLSTLISALVSSTITRQEVVLELENAKNVIYNMQENNFSIAYVNDTLTEGENILKQADYAEILRGNTNASSKDKLTAKNSLSVIDWSKISYSDVLNYTERIKERQKKAFEIYDSMIVLNKKIIDFENQEVDVLKARDIFDSAKNSFYNDRYEESIKFIEDANINLEDSLQQKTNLSGLRNGAMNFFQKYFIEILIFLILAGVFSYFFQKRLRILRLKKKIRKMRIEEEILEDLIKRNQNERFKENQISGLVYNIRMKRYQERIQNIHEELPVLEHKLKTLNKKEKRSKI